MVLSINPESRINTFGVIFYPPGEVSLSVAIASHGSIGIGINQENPLSASMIQPSERDKGFYLIV